MSKTIGDLKDKIKKFLDLEAEVYIKDEELCCWLDMAQNDAHSLINKLDSDYNTSCDEQTVVAKTAMVDLPEDIQGTKIKKIYWQQGKKCCELRRIDSTCDLSCDITCGKPECWLFMNKKDEGKKIYLNPLPNADGIIRIFYTRKSCPIDENTPDDTCLEFDEMWGYMWAYVKKMVYEKEKNPMINLAIAELNQAEQKLEECLETQFNSDEDNTLELDPVWKGYISECNW